MRRNEHYRGEYIVLRHTPHLLKRREGPDDTRDALRWIASTENAARR